MKFGLMYEIQIPEPHHPGIEAERYKQVLAQVDLADEVGFEYFWTVEHHFLREFSHCSAPEVLYGAISQRTKRIRIGHAVALLPSQYNHPVRVAERAAVLDILSDGRMDLGTGRSTTLLEMDGFEVDPEQTKAQWAEAIRMIPKMWTEDPFSTSGRVLQHPGAVGHSQACAAAASAHVGRLQPARQFPAAPASMGLGVLCFNLGGYAQMEERVAAYREAIQARRSRSAHSPTTRWPRCVSSTASEDGDEARRVAGPEGAWFVAAWPRTCTRPGPAAKCRTATSSPWTPSRLSGPTRLPRTTWIPAPSPWARPTRSSR